jgi:hypothetical protein
MLELSCIERRSALGARTARTMARNADPIERALARRNRGNGIGSEWIRRRIRPSLGGGDL